MLIFTLDICEKCGLHISEKILIESKNPKKQVSVQ